MAFTPGLTRSICARCAWTTSVTETSRARMRRASSIAVEKQRSVLMGPFPIRSCASRAPVDDSGSARPQAVAGLGPRRPRCASRSRTQLNIIRPVEEPMNETRTLARFVAETRFTDLPRRLVENLTITVLDTLGAALVGTRQPWAQRIVAVTRALGGTPEATVVHQGWRT